MSDEPIRYGVVGLGRAGWAIHVAGLRGRPDAKIVAVADPVAARLDEARAEFGCKTHPNINALLKQTDIEVVVVATPSVMHGPDTKKAFKAGKHVVCEKPMAMSLAEAKSMIAAAQAAGKKLCVHHNLRFGREFTFYQDTINSGVLGRVFHIRNYTTNFARRNDWQTLVKNGGGVLNNTGSHYIDQILQLVGSPIVQVVGDLRQIASSGDVEDHVKAFMRAANGTTVDLEISSAQNVAIPLPKWIICGSHGTLTSDGKQATIRWFDPAQVQPLPVNDGPAVNRKYANEDKLPWQEKTVDALGTDVGNFYDNVFAAVRRNEPLRVTPESVCEVLRVIALIRKGTAFPGKPTKATAR